MTLPKTVIVAVEVSASADERDVELAVGRRAHRRTCAMRDRAAHVRAQLRELADADRRAAAAGAPLRSFASCRATAGRPPGRRTSARRDESAGRCRTAFAPAPTMCSTVFGASFGIGLELERALLGLDHDNRTGARADAAAGASRFGLRGRLRRRRRSRRRRSPSTNADEARTTRMRQAPSVQATRIARSIEQSSNLADRVCDADLRAVGGKRAVAAARIDRPADVLAPGHEIAG